MKRVIFVGVHNKPGKEPLDSSTVSGKRIDSIIKNLDGYECVKSNLFEIERQPTKDESDGLIEKWFLKYWQSDNDICVLLGNQVQYSFPNIPCKIVRLAHPSLQYSKVSPTDYINNAVTLIHAFNHKFLTP